MDEHRLAEHNASADALARAAELRDVGRLRDAVVAEPDRSNSPATYRAIRTTVVKVGLADSAVLFAVCWLYVRKVLSLYLVLLVVAVMYIATAIVLWRKAPRRGPVAGIRVSKLMWLGVLAFTMAAVGALASWVAHPSVQSGVQAFVSVGLAGYLWWMVRVLKKMQRDNSQKEEVRDSQ